MDKRLILAQALLLGATAIIVAHNHPSGNLQPSEGDRQVSKQIYQACQIMGMQVLDFMILTSNSGYYSFMDSGETTNYAKGGKFKMNMKPVFTGEDEEYGTFEIYKIGGEVEVKIVNQEDKFDKDKYGWLLDDYDKDGVKNADDKQPFNKNNSDIVDRPTITKGLEYLVTLKNTMDNNMLSFVNDLKDVAPSHSKIYARTKTPYSIINKLIQKRLMNPKTGLTDLIGTTIVAKDKKDLDKVKKEIQSGDLGKVIEFEDMYANPKNGYRAYHFLIEKNGMPIEVQVKTKRQKALNELSHEPYKENNLNALKLIKMTEVADKADKGDKKAVAQYNQFMSQPNLDMAFYKNTKMNFAQGGSINNLPPKGELTNKNNLLLKYEKIGSEYVFYVYEPVTLEVSGYKKTKHICKNADCAMKMSYPQFVNYLYAETYLDDNKYAKGGNFDIITENDIVEGAKFRNPTGTIFIVDKVENSDYVGKLVNSSYEGGKKGNYRDSIKDFVSFLNEEKCIKMKVDDNSMDDDLSEEERKRLNQNNYKLNL